MSSPGSQDARRSVALVERLLEVEARVHGLVRDNLNLQRDLASGRSHRSTSGAAFDVPRTAHEWRLADDAGLRPDDLDLYDRRCDDDVVLAGRSGALFLGRFGLLGAEPDFPGAIAEILAAAGSMRRPAAARPRAKPDVSIVIPAYGQLAYTLNCIHSLIGHESRYSAEILVIDDASPDPERRISHSAAMHPLPSPESEWRLHSEVAMPAANFAAMGAKSSCSTTTPG